MKKNGFIATSLIYSFFLVFITLFLTIIADYLQNKVLLNTIETDIKEDINKKKGIKDFLIGDILTFESGVFSSSLISCEGISECIDLEKKLLEVVGFESSLTNGKSNTLILKECNDNSCVATKEPAYYILLDSSKFEINTDVVSSIITITGVS